MASKVKQAVKSTISLAQDTSRAGQTVQVGNQSVRYDSQGRVESVANDGGRSAARYAASSGSSTSSRSGGSASSGGYRAAGTTGASSGGYNAGTNYSMEAERAASRGDWSAVQRALTARQAKIDAQGGNDRGTTNAQILADLRSRYGSTYSGLSDRQKGSLRLSSGGVSYATPSGKTGTLSTGKGWDEGVDYLALAGSYASAGDLDAAYDALRRRGFKMADTGSTGGGTSQDAAYAQIEKLYGQSQMARQSYQSEIAENARRLAEHPTQFGTGTAPELANKMFLSRDGQYWIQYDGSGTPSVARKVSSKVGTGKPNYSDEEVALLSQYYGGSDDYADLKRRIHNLAVVRTGNGRLVDSGGNYASGDAIEPVSLSRWDGTEQTYSGQDRDALRAILDRIRAGETFASGAVAVPRAAQPSGGGEAPGYEGYGYGDPDLYGGYGYGYGGSDLEAYIRQLYRSGLDAQLAALKSAYEKNVLNYQAQADQIAQAYQAQRDQAAAQNDLQRMYMNEVGAVQGLNTGAAGQLALAQSGAYQGALAQLLAAEGQDRAANALALAQLEAGYRGDVDAAAAKSNSAMLEALIDEAVRQEKLAYQLQQDQLSQSNWERQFQLQQDKARQSAAEDVASALLQYGVVPDSATLEAAGISLSDAQALAAVYRAKTAEKTAPVVTTVTETTPETEADPVPEEDPIWSPKQVDTLLASLAMQMGRGREDVLEMNVKRYWDRFSDEDKERVRQFLARYGLTAEEG